MSVESRVDLFRIYLDKAGLDKKSYQIEGVEWCLRNELGINNNLDQDLDLRGGIIADEMGLGKTITMIGLCVANVMRKTLIVLPVILLEQWYNQIYKTTGHKALIYHGSNNKKKITLAMLEKSVIVLTSYQSVVIRNTKKDGIKKSVVNLLHSVRWNRLVFDEAHHLRNTKTKLFSSCYSLNSNIRWLMTGTPIQNKEKDFNSLCLILRIPMEMVKTRFILRRTKKDAGLIMPTLDYHLEKVNWSTISEMALSQSLRFQK
jgi:SNF2 family DNA or RNA helicase